MTSVNLHTYAEQVTALEVWMKSWISMKKRVSTIPMSFEKVKGKLNFQIHILLSNKIT